MKTSAFLLAALLVSVSMEGAGRPRSIGSAGSSALSSLARTALSEDKTAAERAIAALRAAGYPGLSALLERGGPVSPRICWSGTIEGSGDPWRRWCAAVDAVAAQRDASVSGLYWHTDLEKAKQEARATGKPILSLRLLGRLDEELSCANSRFFRVALYANREIAPILRERYVLHWKSERPVPRITVDFGDGRRLERTITGNSVHYVLDANGNPLDALPGLYGPAAFRRWLLESEALAATLARSEAVPSPAVLASFHSSKLAQLSARWEIDRVSAGLSKPRPTVSSRPAGGAVPAAAAMPVAMTKAAVEMPMLKAFSPLGSPLDASLTMLAESAEWGKLAGLHAGEARLDATSRALFERETTSSPHSGQAVASFEASMALDTVRNEYLLHSRIHQWFLGSSGRWDLERLNQEVYAKLFLTPRSDPWLGLAPA
ncbi:MAG TPA: hypothetical protein VK780_09850, partial [Thermoanaerobaculia bacterium]|nr:hypothetical protein [Thermoanaerobaculia bacterium]